MLLPAYQELKGNCYSHSTNTSGGAQPSMLQAPRFSLVTVALLLCALAANRSFAARTEGHYSWLYQDGPPATKELASTLAADPCATLCWLEKVDILDLEVTHVLNSCLQMNVTQYWREAPSRNNWSLVRLEGKGNYKYRNYWTEFALGDSFYSFQSRRTRWFWNLDFTELTSSEIYQTEANEDSGSAVYDSIHFTSTVYRVFNRTTIVEESTSLAQDIPFQGAVKQTVDKKTIYHVMLPCSPTGVW